MKIVTILSSILALGLLSASAAHALTPNEQLGESIFFDNNLSINNNQSCATCHGPTVGWTGPDADINATGAVYEGSITGRFGNRKPPSSAYATPSPILHFIDVKANNKNKNKTEILFIGGNFWDGRATGEKLGNPAADQAQGPFLNPLEQALPDNACVVYRVCNATYPASLEQVYPGSCSITFPVDTDALCAAGNRVPLDPGEREKVETAYDNIALSIAAYEASTGVNEFSSKYDAYLAGMVDLSKEEKKGLNLFKSKGKCANCHGLDPGPNGEPPLLTDFTFDNLGVPRNPDNPFYSEPDFNPQGFSWIDLGLGGFLNSRVDYQQFAPENNGKQKVPTLRNVDLRPSPDFIKAYTHNGYFKTLKQVVHFYNTRDLKPVCLDDSSTEIDESLFTSVEDAMAQGCWPKPEVAANINTSELGSLNLTDAQEDAIVVFMRTLSDGYLP
jgi:cytochrome c peroxidase